MAEKELIRVTDVEYNDESDLVVKLVGRTRDGQQVAKDVYGTKPYMFIPESAPSPEQYEDIRDCIVDVRGSYKSYDGERLLQIVTEYPSDITDVRDKYDVSERYESDLIYERRCTADYGLSGYVRVPSSATCQITEVEDVPSTEVDEPIKPRVCIADIETENPDVFYDDFASDAENTVQAITAYDSYDDEYTLFCLDPDHQVDPGSIRSYMESHWAEYETAEQYTEAPITFKRFGRETALLREYVRYIQEKRPDVVTGWNYVDFDHEYLVNRIRNIDDLNVHALSSIGSVGGWKTERYVPGLPAIDMMAAMKKILYGNKESWSLDYISHDILGLGKVEGEDNSYDENRSKYMAYNVVDVQLCVALDQVQGIVDFWYNIADICSIPIYSVGTTMKECEGYLFKRRSRSEILPATQDTDLDTASGGFVMPPSSGVKDWVGVTDLKSLYPSSIISCNISKETITRDPDEADIIVPDMPLNYEEVPGDITEDDIGWELGEGTCVGFSLDKEGILPKYLKELFSEREELKQLRNKHPPDSVEYERYDNQQRAVKVIMNSFFGVSDHPYFRLSAPGLGDAITGASRYVQWYGVNVIERQDFEVIYGDTDSLMVSLVDSSESLSKHEIVERGIELERSINSGLSSITREFGIPENHPFVDVAEMPHDLPEFENHLWQYEFEKLYRRFFQAGSKKRYAGHTTWKEGKDVDDTDVVGFEAKRSDASGIAKTVQTTFLEKVLKGAEFDELSSFVQSKVEAVRDGLVSIEDIGMPSTINKPVEEYPNRPMPRAVRHVNEHVDGYNWTVGDDPWLVYVDSSPEGTGQIDVIALSWTDDELPPGYELDVERHVELALQPIDVIVEELDYTFEELKTGKQIQGIDIGGGGSAEFDSSETDGPVFEDEDEDGTSSPSFESADGDEPKSEESVFDW